MEKELAAQENYNVLVNIHQILKNIHNKWNINSNQPWVNK